MKKISLAWVIAAVVAAVAVMSLCRMPHHRHALVGCWEATDTTVFIFRDDGSFIGRDFHGHRTFGSWIELNKDQIGFQTLFHAGMYAPQYAEVTPYGMRYAYSDAEGFIDAVPLDYETASRKIALASLNQKGPRTDRSH